MMILYNGRDVRRIQHALKVFAFAQHIGVREQCSTKQMSIVAYAAILHDIGIHEAEKKYHSSAGKLQEIEGPPVAREMLTAVGAPDAIIKRVCFIIGKHHSYNSIDGIDFQIVVEADFLVNIFEDAMNAASIISARKTVFKTQTGIALLESMYKSGVQSTVP
jgi:HD superfamily phosphodiesterase